MSKSGLVSRLNSNILMGFTAGALALGYGCERNPFGHGDIFPEISQSVIITGGVDINYRSNLVDVPQATREIRYNGSLIDTKQITSPSYSETFRGNPKGNYIFDLKGSGLRNIAGVTILNHDPTMKLGEFETDFNKGDSLTIDLEDGVSDLNPEDNPVPIQSVRVLSGDVEASLNDYKVGIKSIENPGTYEVEVQAGSQEGGFVTDTIQGKVLGVLEQIAFWSNRGGNEDIYLVNVDGSGLRRLTTDPGQDLEPTFSSDGEYLFFTSHRTRGTAVWKKNMNGGSPVDITSSLVERARQAGVCSNGEVVVAYRDNGDSEVGIGVISSDGSSFTPVYSEPTTGRVPGSPSWKNDCSEIAFQKYDGAWDIFRIGRNGNGLTNLTDNLETDQLPDWSPDGGSDILFKSNRSGSADLYLMSSDGSNVRRLTDDPGIESEPKFSPDGSKIVFTHDLDFSNPQIYFVSSDGSGEWTQLTFDGEGANAYPTWRPRE